MSELLSKYDVFPENINEEFPLLDIGPSKKTLDPNVFAETFPPYFFYFRL